MNLIRKLRSKNYDTVIEVRVPVRFYWADDGYDGFEFGPLEGCTKHQIKLLEEIIDTLFWEHQAGHFARWIKSNYPKYWQELVEAFDAEMDNPDIPKAFFDAFREDKES